MDLFISKLEHLDRVSDAYRRGFLSGFAGGATMVFVIVYAILLGGCQPPPAWEPGDAPLRVWAPEDGVWLVTLEGCDAWFMTGLTCVREERRSSATVEVVMGDSARTSAADTHYAWEGSWDYEVTVDPSTVLAAAKGNVAYARTVMAHEIGHLLGIWEHLPDGDVLMDRGVTAGEPTTADLEALPFEVSL